MLNWVIFDRKQLKTAKNALKSAFVILYVWHIKRYTKKYGQNLEKFTRRINQKMSL